MERNPDVILRLMRGQRRAGGDGVFQRSQQIVDADLEVHHHLLSPGPAGQVGTIRPHPPAGGAG